MAARLEVRKTYKLYVGGRFPRSESARTYEVTDARGRFLERYDALPASAWLVRPDQHIAARWRRLQPAAVRAALARATCNA